MVMKECTFEKDSQIWKKGDDASFCLLVVSGQAKYTEGLPESLSSAGVFKGGTMVGDFSAMLNHSKCSTTLEAVKDVQAFKITTEDFIGVLQRAPGLSLFFQEAYFVD